MKLEVVQHISSGYPTLCNLVAQVHQGGFPQQSAGFLAEIAGANRCAIFLVSGSGQNFYLAADATLGDSFSGPASVSFPIASDRTGICPLTQVALSQKPLRLIDGVGYDTSRICAGMGLRNLPQSVLLPMHRLNGSLLGVVILVGQARTNSVDMRLTLRAIAAMFELRFDAQAKTASTHQLGASLRFADKERLRLSQQADDALFHQLPGRSPLMQTLRRNLRRLAGKSGPVLVLAEAGRLTEAIAVQLHALSSRRNGQYRYVNAASLTPSRFELDLFGYKRGAIPNVVAARRGLLNEAAQGMIFIEGIEMLDHASQRLLARLLETRSFRPVGSTREQILETRIVVSCDPEQAANLQQNLEVALRGEVLQLPPLMNALSDTSDIVEAEMFHAGTGESWAQATERDSGLPLWLEQCAAGQSRERFSDGARQAVVQAKEAREPLRRSHFRRAFQWIGQPEKTVKTRISLTEAISDFERDLIRRTLNTANGNRAEAAQLLNLPKRTLADKCKRYDLI